MTAIKALLSSKKFITMMVGVAVAIAARLGFDLEPELVAAILGLVAMTIGAQGLADQGKEAAKEAAKGSSTVVMLVVLLGLGAAPLSSGCSDPKGALGRVAGGVIDCMTPAAKDAIGAFAPAMANVVRNATSADGHVDWDPVRAVAKPLKTPAQQCVLAAVISEALRPRVPRPDAPQSSPLQWDPVSLAKGFEEVRAEWGGARFKLEAGTL